MSPAAPTRVRERDATPRTAWASHGVACGLVVAAFAVACTAACRTRPEAGSSTESASEVRPGTSQGTLQPPEGRGLQAVALPDLSTMEAMARQQFEAQLSASRATLANAGSSPGDLARAYGDLGKLCLAATSFESAESALLNAQTLAPADPQWPYYLGQLYRAKGPVERSIESFERVLSMRPDDLPALIWLGESYLSQGRPDAAEPRFARAAAIQPGLSAAHYGLGRVKLAVRDFTSAAKSLETALTLEPRASAIHYPLAMAYRGLGDAARANAHLAQQGKLEPRPTDPLMAAIDNLLESAQAFNVRGGYALDVGNWSLAADHFRKALALSPQDASLHHRLGTALSQLGDGPGAMAEFRRAIELAPDHARAHYSLGLLLADSGQLDEADTHLGKAAELEPGYAPAHTQRANVLVRLRRYPEAEAAFDRALALEPANADAAFGRAMVSVRRGRYADARNRLNQWIASHPDQPTFRHALARLLAAAPDDAVRNGRRAKELVDELLKGGESLELGETTAMMLAELGRFQEAAAVQRDVLTAAQGAGLQGAVARLTANLERYQRGEPCRTPFAESELP